MPKKVEVKTERDLRNSENTQDLKKKKNVSINLDRYMNDRKKNQFYLLIGSYIQNPLGSENRGYDPSVLSFKNCIKVIKYFWKRYPSIHETSYYACIDIPLTLVKCKHQELKRQREREREDKTTGANGRYEIVP